MNKSNRELSAEQRAAKARVSDRLTIGPRIIAQIKSGLNPIKPELRTHEASHIIDSRNPLSSP